MKPILLSLAAFLACSISVRSDDPDPEPPMESGSPIYVNKGDNVKGFVLKEGSAHFSVTKGVIIGAPGGGWYELPVQVTDDFRIDLDVYGDSGDIDAHVLLYDEASSQGIDIRDCPQDTDTPTINMYASNGSKDLFNGNTDAVLATAMATHFPNKTWTHVTIMKTGNTLSDIVGGQILKADLSKVYFPPTARIGLGYYSTKNLGGNGQVGYANIRVVEMEPDLDAPEAPETPAPGTEISKPDPEDGTDLALGATASASYTCQYDKIEEINDGKIAMDPNSRNRWTAFESPNKNDWVELDFPKEVSISRIKIYWWADGGGVLLPKDYTLQYWNEDDWDNAAALDHNPDPRKTGTPEEITLVDQVDTKKLRITFDHALPGKTGVTEIAVFEK